MPQGVCIGEAYYQCVHQGARTTPGDKTHLGEAPAFIMLPGGSPAQVAVGLARQGVTSGFVGRVSDDPFGNDLTTLLDAEHVQTTWVLHAAHSSPIRMSYRYPGPVQPISVINQPGCADEQLDPTDVCPQQFRYARVLFFTSRLLHPSRARIAIGKAAGLARDQQAVRYYAPDLRLDLWESTEPWESVVSGSLYWADVVQLNKQDLRLFTGSTELSAADQLQCQYKIPLLMVTLDAQGTYIVTASGSQLIPGFIPHVVDPAALQNGVSAGMVVQLVEHLNPAQSPQQAISELSSEELSDMVRYANAAGALASTKSDTTLPLWPMPTREEVDNFLSAQPPNQ